jgi:hypothetical protein
VSSSNASTAEAIDGAPNPSCTSSGSVIVSELIVSELIVSELIVSELIANHLNRRYIVNCPLDVELIGDGNLALIGTCPADG